MSAELRSAGPPRLHDDVLDVRLRFSKIGAFISASLILLGVGLDLATYPERLGEFFALRVVTALIKQNKWSSEEANRDAQYKLWAQSGTANFAGLDEQLVNT